MSTKKKTSTSKISTTAASVGNAATGTNLLDSLHAIATQVESTAAENQRWSLPLTPEAQETARKWINAKVVFDPAKSRMENERDAFVDYAMNVMCEKLFANKSRPSNPVVQIRNSAGQVESHFQFLMTDRFKVRLPDVPKGQNAQEFYASVFVEVADLHPQDAESLVKNELDLTPQIELRSPKELTLGRYGENREWIEAKPEEKVAGEKMVALLMWNGAGSPPPALTAAEKALVLESSASVKVRAGFYDRVALYCRSAAQIQSVFGLIQPTVYPAQHKFGVDCSETERAQRKVAAAAEILGG